MKKALILFGSPRTNGNCQVLVNNFIKYFKGEIEIIYLFPHLNNGRVIKSCNDCRACQTTKGCIIKDDFSKLLIDDYDILVIASPIYMSNLPPYFWNIISRFNFTFNNRVHLSYNITFKPKKGVLLLVGGGGACKKLMGNSNEENAVKQAEYIFNKLNIIEYSSVFSLNTDKTPTVDDKRAIDEVIKLASSL